MCIAKHIEETWKHGNIFLSQFFSPYNKYIYRLFQYYSDFAHLLF